MAKKSRSTKAVKRKAPPKRIFIFADGTGNSAHSVNKTNVWRMFQALDKNSNLNGGLQKKETLQLCLYDNGVGTSALGPRRILGQVFGIGLKRNVLDAYEFICTHYEPGAELYLIGFSRGAFTMRMLAALIGNQGILKVGFEPQQVPPPNLNYYSKFAYQRFANSAFPATASPIVFVGRALRTILSETMVSLSKYSPYETKERYDQRMSAQKVQSETGWFKRVSDNIKTAWKGFATLRRPDRSAKKIEGEKSHVPDGAVDISFMGLFDTVSAYGGPVEELTEAFNALFWPIEPTDWQVGNYVRKVCHALALDEPRHSFSPKLITEAQDQNWDGLETYPTMESDDRIEQVWFAGAHANVGGGYANDGLSMIPLRWMIRKLSSEHGVVFNEDKVQEIEGATDCCATQHDPRDGLGAVYRYSPRSLSGLTEDVYNRVYVDVPKVHHSVLHRVVENPGYAPVGLDKDYVVVDDDGIVPYASDAASTIAPQFEELSEIDRPASSLSMTSKTSRFNGFVERAWDIVWRKRVVYFCHLFLGLTVLALPAIFKVLEVTDFSRGLKPVDSESCKNSTLCLLMKPADFLGSSIDGWLPFGLNIQPWINLIKNFPGFSLGVVGAFAGLWLIGKTQKKMVNTSLTEYWLSRAGKTTMTEPEPQPSLIFRLRSHGAYQQFFFQLKRRIMPFVWGVALIFLAIFSVSQADLYLRNYSVPQLAFCPAPGPSQATTAIDIENLCNDTGFDVRDGTMYALKIRPEKTCDGATQNKPWFDASIPASPAGVTSDDSNSLVSTLSLPIRRVLDQKLFAPIIQINQTFPKVTPASEYGFWAREGDGDVWLGYFKANASGRAYFFVNDAVAPLLPSSLQFFYGNNCGKGTLSIEKFQ